MKFGVQICQGGMTYSQFKEAWLECEGLGFDSVWAYDHLDNCLEGWTLISALAGLTPRIRFGLLVTCNSYRHPPVLAKMASTLDIISGGRLEFGIGAGDAPSEYVGYGVPFPKASIRIEQLDEAIQIIKKIWTEDRPTFKGRFYSIKETLNDPKPVQKPYPPIWIGSLTGKRRIATVAAKHADVYNTFADTPSEFENRMEVLRKSCLEVGRRYEGIGKTLTTGFTILRTRSEFEEKVAKEAKQRGVSPDEFREHIEGALYGTPDVCAEVVKKYAQVGVESILLIFSGRLESLQAFSEVIQQFE